MDAWSHPFYFWPMAVCLNIHNYVVVYIDYDFSNYEFGMLTSDSTVYNKLSYDKQNFKYVFSFELNLPTCDM